MMLDSILLKEIMPDLRVKFVEAINGKLEDILDLHIKYSEVVVNLINLHSKTDD